MVFIWTDFEKVLPRVHGIWTVRFSVEDTAQMILTCKGLEIKSWSSGRTSVFNDAKNYFANTREKNLQRQLCSRQNAIRLIGTESSAVRNRQFRPSYKFAKMFESGRKTFFFTAKGRRSHV